MRQEIGSVITIILEDYANPANTATEIKEVLVEAGLAADDLILKSSDLNGGAFPTLQWIRDNNRRLVIFTQRAATTDVTWNQFTYCFENSYSTEVEAELVREREESAAVPAGVPRSLVVFNNFPGISEGSGTTVATATLKRRIAFNNVKDLLRKAAAHSFAHRRLVNGYWADRIIGCTNDLESSNERTVFAYINERNSLTSHGVDLIEPGRTEFWLALEPARKGRIGNAERRVSA